MAASIRNVFCQISRFGSWTHVPSRNISVLTRPLEFRASYPVFAEPMKKKKKQDVNIIIQKETKKRRKIEKAIRRLESKGRKLKPVDEIEGDRSVLKTVEIRQREIGALPFEETERRALLMKKWSVYRFHQFTSELNKMQKIMRSQERALEELRLESEDLYQAAIQTDSTLIPLDRKGPTHTPPTVNYEAPDGEYIDTTKVFDK